MVFADASKAKVQITKAQEKAIKKMYQELSEEIAEEAARISVNSNISSILRVQYLDNLSKQVNQEIRRMGESQKALIQQNMKAIAEAVVANNQKFLNSVGINISGAYSHVPTEIVKEVASGNLYNGRWTLSKAIWRSTAKAQSDINMVVAKGIAGQKSTYEIAKDLEKYVNPSARKDWAWSKVYPGSAKTVDYNAQRLARTMVSHAYQDAIVRTTKDNPFVDCYQWLTSGGHRVCPICIDRENEFHGVVINGVEMPGCYYADELPLDHPNGMCTIDTVIPYSYMEISDRLADWVNGSSDEGLDNFAESLGYSPVTLRSKV